MEALAKKEVVDPKTARQTFMDLRPRARKMHKELGDDKKVWQALLESVKVNATRFRPDCNAFAKVCVSFLVVLDVTPEIERIFSRVQLLEAKRRSASGIFALRDAVLVIIGVSMVVNELVEKTPSQYSVALAGHAPVSMVLVWKPGRLIRRAQTKYLEFYGARKMWCRSLAPTTLATKRKLPSRSRARLKHHAAILE